jgi:hypothetical protein
MSAPSTQRLEIIVDMSRAQVEALQLEIRRLAAEHDVVIARVRIEKAQQT